MASPVYFFLCALLFCQNIVNIQATFEVLPKPGSSVPYPKLTCDKKTVTDLGGGKVQVTAEFADVKYHSIRAPVTVGSADDFKRVVDGMFGGRKAKDYFGYLREKGLDGMYTISNITGDNGVLLASLENKTALK